MSGDTFDDGVWGDHDDRDDNDGGGDEDDDKSDNLTQDKN